MFVGGVRSGKSGAAQKWLESRVERPLYVATCEPRDPETLERVARHRAARGDRWSCLESPLLAASDLERFFSERSSAGWGAMVDCVSMFIANALEIGEGRQEMFARLEKLFGIIEKFSLPLALVSAECGLGFVPLNPLARNYGDLLGETNQFCANYCESAYIVSCGLLLPLKEANRPVCPL